MQLPIISIVGPTASGKTELALNLASRLITRKVVTGAAVISADSRQVYQGLELLTGGDIPANFVKKVEAELNYAYFVDAEESKISLHGVSIIKPTDEWSVAHFRTMSQQLIKKYIVKNYIIIIVGGTGLYHDYFLSNDPAISVAPNLIVREKANQLSLAKLKQWAESTDSKKYRQMNHSDQNNPRRLIRLIEIALAQPTPPTQTPELLPTPRHFYLGLQLEPEELAKRIRSRVLSRLEAGAVLEVEQVASLLDSTKTTNPAYKTLGFREILAYTQGEITKEECVAIWTKKELAYSKRQMTWFKKNKAITWLKADDPGIVNQALTCYTKFYDVSIF